MECQYTPYARAGRGSALLGAMLRVAGAVPTLAFDGVPLPLPLRALLNRGGRRVLNAGLMLIGVECLIVSIVIRRSARRGRAPPETIRRHIFTLNA